MLSKLLHIQTNRILLFGLVVHLITAYFSIGYHQCDELFQIYEFAGYKSGLNQASELPWEFGEKIRSGIEPFFVYAITKLFHALSATDPFTISLVLRLCVSLLAFFGMVQLIRLFEKELEDEPMKKALWWLALLFWFLPYFHARLSSENFSSALFLWGLVFVLRTENTASYVIGGLLFGLAFHARFQIGFMVAGLFAWLLLMGSKPFSHVAVLIIGFAAALGIGLLADRWLYGQYTLSWWNYLDMNFFKDKASVYGREPVWFYISEALLQLIPPFSLIIVAGVLMFWVSFKRHLLTWITLPFVLLHFFVAHKELRFLFPVLNFLPFMLILLVQKYKNPTGIFARVATNRILLTVFVIINGALLLYFGIKPADETTHSLKAIYDHCGKEPSLLLYGENDPYSDLASLHYFRSPLVRTQDLKDTTRPINSARPVYYFTTRFNEGDSLVIRGRSFSKLYSNFPGWFTYVNINDWLSRANTFTIYRTQ